MINLIKKMIGTQGRITKPVLFAMLCVLSGVLPASKATAQAVAVSEVTGYVTDPNGHAVAAAQVSMTETGTDQTHTTTSEPHTGRYSIPNLDVGAYVLTVTGDGFRKYVQTGIILRVASNISINVQLQIGALTQTVEVQADAEMIETKDNSIAQVFDSQRIDDLPLNGRNPSQLILLTGAATTDPAPGDLISSKNIGGSNASGAFSIAGGQANSVNYLLDGGDNNDPLFNVNLPLPFPDAIQEFSVQTSSLPAQYGLHPGGVVNAVTRSGSNEYHGDLFEFLRNGDMDAIQDGTPSRDSLKRSQFGGVLGGRIIPNKLFFFTGYQGTRQRSTPPSQIAYVATAAALEGDFSTLDGPKSAGGCIAGAGKQLIDPVTKAPFTNNQIPPAMFDSAAVKLLTNYLPVSSNPCGEIQFGFLSNNPDDQVIGRVDYDLNQKHSMYGRYYIYDFTAQTVFNGSNLLTTASPGEIERSQTFTFGDSYTFSSNTLNSFHATFDRRRDDRGSAPNDINPTALGINMTALLPNYLQITASNYFAIGCTTCSPGHFNANTYQVSNDMILIRGRHELGFGADIRRLQANLLTNTYTNGVAMFNGSHTGDSLADTLLGYMSGFSQANPQPDALRESVFSFYAQDTFRATKRLTLNLGLRWEPAEFPYDNLGRAPQFSLPAFSAGTMSKAYPSAPAGLVFPEDPGSYPGKSQVKSYWLDLSPRIGVIYDPRGKGDQNIRAGFALMHDTGMMYYPERWTYSPPFASQVNLTNPVGDSFSNPWANQAGGNPFPEASFFPVAGTYYIIPTDMRPTYELQWNLNIQQKIGPDWLVQVGYLGTRSIHVWSDYDINPSVYIAGSTAPANDRRLLYLQNQTAGQYYGAIYSGDDEGHGLYDALLFSFQHGFAKYFQATANYTWSHCISDADLQGEVNGTAREDPYSLSFERGNCNFDVTSLFNLSAVVSSPNLGPGIARMLVRNWQLSPIITWHSGNVLNITDGGFDISGTAQLNDRPNQVLANPYPATKTTGEWFNSAAFAEQAPGAFGNVHRNSLYGPGAFDMDDAIGREFRFTERLRFLFRVDAFNALNHPIWNAPATSITSAQFGKITTFGSPRILQLGSKITF